MIVSSNAKKPKIHASAYVAPSATIAGDVTIESGCAILHGAVIVSEGAPVTIGSDTVVMENAVLRASGGAALQFPLTIGERCIVGPHAYVVGASIGEGCLIASGAKIYNGARLEDGSGVAPGAIVGVDAESAEFFETVFNLQGSDDVRARAAETYAKFLRKIHAQDAALGEHRATKPPPRRSGEEPPPTQATAVDKVVDVMMFELEEMEHRRQEAIKRQKGR
jgi:carbonic anhydrase/acetyltransferase-like protein (isoleucine patch superfamily)